VFSTHNLLLILALLMFIFKIYFSKNLHQNKTHSTTNNQINKNDYYMISVSFFLPIFMGIQYITIKKKITICNINA